ncbi:MAG: hypothetical protein AB1Z98_26870 [Nannocystaceae bacterium]
MFDEQLSKANLRRVLELVVARRSQWRQRGLVPRCYVLLEGGIVAFTETHAELETLLARSGVVVLDTQGSSSATRGRWIEKRLEPLLSQPTASFHAWPRPSGERPELTPLQREVERGVVTASTLDDDRSVD